MARKYPDPEAPEVLAAVLQRIRAMTRDEWLQALAWSPEGVEATWRMQRGPDQKRSEIATPLPLDTACDDQAGPDPVILATSREASLG
jgi:hypothetical protein